LLFVLLKITFAIAQTNSSLPRYPWHLADVWWTTKEAIEFNELSIDFRVNGNISQDHDLYIAPLGLIKIGATPIYGGIQTNVSAWKSKSEQTHLNLGLGAIFSKWSSDNTPITLDHAKGSSDSYFEAAGYEGNFISVRKKYVWSNGYFTYSIRRASIQNEKNSIWYTAYIKNHTTNVETEVGSLKTDKALQKLSTDIASFVEVYGAPNNSSSAVPQVTVIFNEPKIDGKYSAGIKSKIYYPTNTTSGKPRYATAFAQDRSIHITTIPTGVNDGRLEEPSN
jgi:Domain of unknown function (DUF3472)